MYRSLTVFAVAIGVTATAGAQQFQRRATMVGGGGGDRGKCTIEVVVDGVAEVEIRGDQGVIRNISGRPAEWRRFECNAPLPRNPAGFRFAGVDGRGRQDLVRDPRNGGAAVVRIEDSKGGAEGYTFDLFWGGDNRGPGPGAFPLPAAIVLPIVIVPLAASLQSKLSVSVRIPSAGWPASATVDVEWNS